MQRVQNPGQALLAIVKLARAKEDIEARSKRRTLERRRWNHLVRSDGGMGRIHQVRSKAGMICRLHRHLHRAKREITPPSTYPLRDGKGHQVHRVTRVGQAKAVTGKNQGKEIQWISRLQPMMCEA